MNHFIKNVSITETGSELELTICKSLLRGLDAIPTGACPATHAISTTLGRSITEMIFEKKLVK
jgi:hypothetical protein